MRRLFQAGGDKDPPAPRGQFIQGLEQRLDFLLAPHHPLRVEGFVAELQQFFHFLAGQQPGIGLAPVRGDIQGHAVQVGIGLGQVQRCFHAVDPQVGFMQDVIGQILGTQAAPQAHLEVVVGGQEQPDHRTVPDILHTPAAPLRSVQSMLVPAESGIKSRVTGWRSDDGAGRSTRTVRKRSTSAPSR